MLKIQREDKEMVEQLKYDQLPAEYSVRADLPQIMFRKLRQQVRGQVVGRAGQAGGVVECRWVATVVYALRQCQRLILVAVSCLRSMWTWAMACPASSAWRPLPPTPCGTNEEGTPIVNEKG